MEFKRCPFCGGKGRMTTDGGGFRVCCEKCFANTRLSIDEETAVDTWNKRYPVNSWEGAKQND